MERAPVTSGVYVFVYAGKGIHALPLSLVVVVVQPLVSSALARCFFFCYAGIPFPDVVKRRNRRPLVMWERSRISGMGMCLRALFIMHFSHKRDFRFGSLLICVSSEGMNFNAFSRSLAVLCVGVWTTTTERLVVVMMGSFSATIVFFCFFSYAFCHLFAAPAIHHLCQCRPFCYMCVCVCVCEFAFL